MFESKEKIEAWVSCGDDYYYGKNGEKIDYEMAVYFYEKAERKKHPYATHMLGLCYKLGHYVEKDLEYAETLFEKAIKYGYKDTKKHLTAEKKVSPPAPKPMPVPEEIESDEEESFDITKIMENLEGKMKNLEDELKEAGEWDELERSEEKSEYSDLISFEEYYESQKSDAQIKYERELEQREKLKQLEEEIKQWEQGGKMPIMSDVYCVDLAWGYFKKGDYKRTYELCEPWARDGYDCAQHLLGRMYAEGKGVEEDHEKAKYWYGRAAQQGHEIAIKDLKDIERIGKTLKWFNEANQKQAENKESERKSIIQQAVQLRNAGNGKDAVKLLEQVAQQNDSTQCVADAALMLGIMYIKGVEIDENLDEAEKWLRKAVGIDSEGAQNALDNLHEKRADNRMLRALNLMDKDDVQAIRLFKEILEQDDSIKRRGEAACAIGMIYAYGGNGVKQDVKAAYFWFKDAATFGDEHAKKMLKEVYGE